MSLTTLRSVQPITTGVRFLVDGVDGADRVERRVREIVAELVTTPGLESIEVMDCDPDLADTAAFCEAYGFSEDQSANTIIVAGKGDPAPVVACVVLATTRLDVNKAVRKKMGVRKASFAPGELTTALTGMMIGGVTVIGLPAELPIWVDAAVMGCDRIVLGGGSRSAKVLGPPALLSALPNVEIVEGLANSM